MFKITRNTNTPPSDYSPFLYDPAEVLKFLEPFVFKYYLKEHFSLLHYILASN